MGSATWRTGIVFLSTLLRCYIFFQLEQHSHAKPIRQNPQRRTLRSHRNTPGPIPFVILYNKPADVVTTHAVEDVLGRKNVFQDIMSRPSQQNVLPAGFPQGWHAVGRLDADTTGLLLLTNDGGLVHHVTNRVASSAKIPTEKRYEAIIMGHYEDDCEMFEQFRSVGVDIGGKNGGRTLPVQQIHAVGHPNHKSTIVSIALVEGKNRQIRRMFHSSGSGVMRLTRTAIGDELTLSMVPNEGDWCILRNEQIISALHWVPEGYTGKQQ